MREVQDEAGRAKVRGSMFEVFGMSNPAQDFRIGSPVSQPLLERRLVELEEVEKIAIEANGQIGIVLNLAGMTESNLVDDSFKMGDVSQSGFRTPWILCVLIVVPRIPLALRPRRTVSYLDQRYRISGLNMNKGGLYGNTTGR